MPTIPAANTSQAAVQAAIDAAVNGDTVNVPAGSATWTAPVTISGKSLTVKGAGVGQTIITGNMPTSDYATMTVNVDVGGFVTVSGFEFHTLKSSNYGIVNFGPLNSAAARKVGFRMTKCKAFMFPNTTGERGIAAFDIYGLIDNCTVVNTGDNGQAITIDSGGAQYSVANWHEPQVYGDQNAVVIEDCTLDFAFDADGVDAYTGAKFVFRHNTVINTNITPHGYDTAIRSCRMFEIYQNTFTSTTAGNPWVFMRMRGGSGVVWGNTFTGATSGFCILSAYRSDPSLLLEPIGAPNDGGFGGAFPTGYPLLDQIGRGSFPAGNPGNWPNSYPYTPAEYEASDPMYLWNNVYNGDSAPIAGAGNPATSSTYIVEGRDFYNNTVKPGYSPLAYPHPLRAGDVPPSAPVSAVVLGEGSFVYGSMSGPETIPGPASKAMQDALVTQGWDVTDARCVVAVGESSSCYGSMKKAEGQPGQMQESLG